MRRRTHSVRIFWWLAVLATSIASSGRVYAELPVGFVYLHDIDASIAQDIRYAGDGNFVGHPLPGYGAAECVLQAPAALALAAVQAELAIGTSGETLGLKVYDCYRPSQAVQAMVAWAKSGDTRSVDPRFFPNLPKNALLARGYIATRSAHSTGLAVDLTLAPRASPHSASKISTVLSGPCSGPADDSVDMGTGFDCFDQKARTADPGVGAAVLKHRGILLAAMRRHGFVNYPGEWWHFRFGAPVPGAKTFDFPIGPRPSPR
jgi:D-alanyl-D-alanine dipeptidase